MTLVVIQTATIAHCVSPGRPYERRSIDDRCSWLPGMPCGDKAPVLYLSSRDAQVLSTQQCSHSS